VTTDHNDTKTVLKRYLQAARDALLWKVEGLDERTLRMPQTPTGTNLIGIVKHAANIEIGYFGGTFGRVWPTDEAVPTSAYDADPQADFYLTEQETADGIVDFYRRVWSFADATIDELPLDARGRVAWWPEDRAEVTLERIIVHVTEDLARHAGHADVVRELIDGSIGLSATNSNVPDMDWPEYVAKLTALAEQY
jgi:hypothetical protein